MAETIALRYDVPLYVEVDIATSKILKVTVDDDHPKSMLHDLREAFAFHPDGGFGEGDRIDSTDPRVGQAIEVVSVSQDWPGWDFGW